MVVYAHLTFNGNCRQAMIFYQECLGGQLEFQTVGQSPLSSRLPKRMRDCIVEATLINHSLVLTGSDMVPDSGLIKGNSLALSLQCDSERELRAVFQKLSTNGTATKPLQWNVAGALVGGLTDPFGTHWWLTWNAGARTQVEQRDPQGKNRPPSD